MSLSLSNNAGQSLPLEAVRVLVVDDHPLVRHGLVALIGSEFGFEPTMYTYLSSGDIAVVCMAARRLTGSS